MFSFFPSNRGCDDTHPTDGVPVGPARGQADSNTGPQRSLKVIGSSRADFPSWPGAPKTLLTEVAGSVQERVVRESRTLRAMWRGLETDLRCG